MELGAFSISLTFNPGWDQDAEPLDTFTDVRELQRQLKARGVELVTEADESSTGPASFTAVDPDGNPILVDQHREGSTDLGRRDESEIHNETLLVT
jgi:hypothetical protein